MKTYRFLKDLIISYAGWLTYFSYLDDLVMNFSERIRDEKHLSEMCLEESRRLGLRELILTRFTEDDSQVSLTKSGLCRVHINYGQAHRSVLRHELKHVKNRAFGSEFKYFFEEEPRAILYETFGLDL